VDIGWYRLSLLCLGTKYFAHHHSKIAQCLAAIAAIARAMHNGQRPRLARRQALQHATSVMRIRHVIGKRTGLRLLQRLFAGFEDVVLCGRFAVSPLMEQVGAKESTLRFFKQDTSISPMRHVRNRQKAKTILAGRQDVVGG